MIANPIRIEAMKLAPQLKGLLRQRGTTVTHLAKATKIPVQTISNWLSGAKPRDFDQVKKVADYLKITLDELVYGEEPRLTTSFEDFREEINAGVFEVILRKPRRK